MNITLEINNADEGLLRRLKEVINLYPQARLEVKTINGFNIDFEKEILQDLENIATQKKLGNLKTYSSVKEAFTQEGLI